VTATAQADQPRQVGQFKAERVQTAARESLGLAKLGGVAAFELRALLDQITFLEQQVAATEQQIETLLAACEQHLTDATWASCRSNAAAFPAVLIRDLHHSYRRSCPAPL
jgi:transposase